MAEITLTFEEQAELELEIVKNNAPSGQITIEANGTYDVTDKAEAVVDVDIGGLIDVGFEVLEHSATGYPSKIKIYGEEIPDYFMNYCFWSIGNNYPLLIANDEIKDIGNSAFSNCHCEFDDHFLDFVETMGDSGITHLSTDQSKTEINLLEFTGKAKNGTFPKDLFRTNSNFLTNFYLPKCKNLGQYWWYQNNKNISVQIGSVGYGVEAWSGGIRPFGSATGTSTVTVYTTGAKLDALKADIMNQAGANYTFIFKASEDTVYNGTPYSADEIMLTA